MASSSTYEYTAIVAPKTIRLLRLHPGAPTDPVSISLETVALDSTPDFEAISYCWGQALQTQRVTCNGAALFITNSLLTGLVHFRYADRPRMLWADAICINQADATEKGGQVLLMPHIYSQATSTLVWLGVADDPDFGLVPPNVGASISQALEWLPELDPDVNVTEAVFQTLYSDSVRLHDEGKPNLLDHDWAPLAALMTRPWFRRKWVIQEVALAKQVVLYTGGGVQVPWSDVARLGYTLSLMGLEKFERLEAGNTVLTSIVRPLECVSCILMIQLYKSRATLVDGVVNSMTFNCTDPKDHIYSLLSLVNVGPTIFPDYNISVSEMLHRFAIATMVEARSLKLLSLAPDKIGFSPPRAPRLEGLPSWVPDVQCIRLNWLASYTVVPQMFSAGGHDKPVLSLSDDQRVLGCRGRVIDTVKTTSRSIIEALLDEVPELRHPSTSMLRDPSEKGSYKRQSRWLKTCYQIAFGQPFGSEPATIPNEELMSAFARTMLCGMESSHSRLSAKLIAAFPHYMQWAIERAQDEQDESEKHPMLLPGYSANMDTIIRVISSALKFSVTEHGRFGHLPPNTQPGDRICVLVGGEVPFVIRPTGRETYALIGESYVDGIMDGEALAGQETKLLETIHLE
ncbi:heterokaryon incompatibility protein-domain-containing protein [Xylaria intraflava]|nr:heterokaryon incompatibility protein-domain-containing protein [Xylaria intraflava]